MTGATHWMSVVSVTSFDYCQQPSPTVTITISAFSQETSNAVPIWTFQSCWASPGSVVVPFTLDYPAFPHDSFTNLVYEHQGPTGPCIQDLLTFKVAGPPNVDASGLPLAFEVDCGGTITLPPPTFWEHADTFQWCRLFGTAIIPVGPVTPFAPTSHTITNASIADAGKWACVARNCFTLQPNVQWNFDLIVEKNEVYGTGCAGSGGVVPELSVIGCPESGQVATIRVEKALGGSNALLLLGTGRGLVPMAGDCNLLLQPLLPVAVSLPLSGTGVGNGEIEVAVTIPAGLPTATATLQAFVADSGVAFGYSNSNGVELKLP